MVIDIGEEIFVTRPELGDTMYFSALGENAIDWLLVRAFGDEHKAGERVMSIDQQVNELAASMGVSVIETKCFINSVVSMMRNDGITQEKAEKLSELAPDLPISYITPAIKKFENFQTKLQTNRDSNAEFKETVYLLLKKGILERKTVADKP